MNLLFAGTKEVLAPSAPTGLAVSSPTETAALSWNAVATATSYNIYRDGTKIDNTTNASYTDNNAPQGSHSYYVTAVNASGESGPSNTADVLVNLTPPTTTAALSPDPYTDDGTYPNPVTVTLTAKPAQPGITVTATYYTVDGGSQQAYTAPFTVSGPGRHVITYWSADNCGEQETLPKSTTFVIHRPPAINPLSSATVSEGDTFTQAVTFASTASNWTATVAYGDGSAPQTLSLSATTLPLSHMYATREPTHHGHHHRQRRHHKHGHHDRHRL